MLRNKLIDNLRELNDTEVYTLEYLTRKPLSWFLDKHHVSDKEVRETLYNSFVHYFGYAPQDGVHPYYKVWEKVVVGSNIDELICQTDLYGKEYKELAEQINELYMSNYCETIQIILKAFAERDFEEIADKYCLGENVTYANFDNDMIVGNLDNQDLKTIILFCGKIPNLYHN